MLNRQSENTHILLEDDLVRKLARIMREAPDSHLVLTTFWRHFAPYITYILWRHGIDSRRIVGITSGYDSTLAAVDFPCGHKPSTLEWTGQPTYASRADEIRVWLSEHPNVRRFVIIDDRASAADKELLPHFVHTHYATGLDEEEVAAANSILETDREQLAMMGTLSDLFDEDACERALQHRRLQATSAAAAVSESSTVWLMEWRVRFDCWFAALPKPTQNELGSCLGALGLHLGHRLDAAWREAQSIFKPSLPVAAPSAGPLPEGCEWVQEAGRLQLPEFPAFPNDRADFTLPPIPRLLPSLHLPRFKSRRMKHLQKSHSASPKPCVLL